MLSSARRLASGGRAPICCALLVAACASPPRTIADGSAPDQQTRDGAAPADAARADQRPDLGPAPPAPWPRWALEHWVWEDESTQQSALALVEGYLARDIPVGALIIDSPWATGYNTFEFDRARFPDPAAMIAQLHARGVRVVLWVVPAINTDVPGLYEEAASKGYFMQTSADSGPDVFKWWKGEGSLLDYFNPQAVAWWHALVDQALALQIDGWKCDGLDAQAVLTSYSPYLGRKVQRPEYSAAYYGDFFDYTRAQLGDDRLIMSRPVDSYGVPVGGPLVAFTPREITWAGWVGDQDATFDGLEKALLNMALSAAERYVIIGSDVGGYREDGDYPTGRGKELFVRWAQLGALSPLLENGGGGDHHPWAFDDETVAIYRTFVKLHYALIPYLDEHGARAMASGEPLMRFVESRYSFEYLLGPDIFVAPLLRAGGEREVPFPEGRWSYLFDRSRSYAGGTREKLSFPLDEYPVFLREGSPIAGARLLPAP